MDAPYVKPEDLKPLMSDNGEIREDFNVSDGEVGAQLRAERKAQAFRSWAEISANKVLFGTSLLPTNRYVANCLRPNDSGKSFHLVQLVLNGLV
ncbi:hypothetical protein WA026_010162 [Henosepilachna vigintioctopunctata]|uniref:Uncharacterized protein n=1 Tax=Henosepilachna vigintioctopunctata TaxID=420089 RepID=A0AAW1ULJ1_9CUCU